MAEKKKPRAKTAPPEDPNAPFLRGERAYTYIGGARVEGVVVEYIAGAPRRSPVVAEIGTGLFEGWVRLSYTHPGKVRIRTDRTKSLVTRTELSFGNITKGTACPLDDAAEEIRTSVQAAVRATQAANEKIRPPQLKDFARETAS